MEPIGCPETSVANYQSIVYNIQEKQRSHLYHGGCLKLCMFEFHYWLGMC